MGAADHSLLLWTLLTPPLLHWSQVHIKTRHEIEEKKKQLRSVVGDSYRCAAAALPNRLNRLLVPQLLPVRCLLITAALLHNFISST